MKKKQVVNQLTLEIRKVSSNKIEDPETLKKLLGKLCRSQNIRVLKTHYHRFKPQGLTMIMILSTSHLAFHTWPENKTAHLDLVTCQSEFEQKEFILEVRKIFPGSQIKELYCAKIFI